jgi:hypothetical protein
MTHEVDRRRKLNLQQAFETLQTMDPRGPGSRLDFGDDFDADIDMWAEDSYLAGLVTQFLRKSEISVKEICINRHIDERFRALLDESSSAERVRIERFIRYREKMLELARLLSDAANVPLRICG